MSTLPYRGVNFLTHARSKKWKAQIIRRGILFYLGTFETPKEAAEVYDNASYFTRQWLTRPRSDILNYPDDWKTPADREPLLTTVNVLARLRRDFPIEEGEEKLSRATEIDRLECVFWEAAKEEVAAVGRKGRAVTLILSRCRALEEKLKSAQKEIDSLKNIVEGMRLQGGALRLNPVTGSSATPDSVESHLK